MDTKTQSTIWEAQQWSGMEYLRLERASEIIADGTIILLEDSLPLRILYHLRCDPTWAVRQVVVEIAGSAAPKQQLEADGIGHWTTDSGQPMPSLEGCIDVDIAATPFTNTLP